MSERRAARLVHPKADINISRNLESVLDPGHRFLRRTATPVVVQRDESGKNIAEDRFVGRVVCDIRYNRKVPPRARGGCDSNSESLRQKCEVYRDSKVAAGIHCRRREPQRITEKVGYLRSRSGRRRVKKNSTEDDIVSGDEAVVARDVQAI